MHLPSLLPSLLLTLSTLLLPVHANSYNETRCFCATAPNLTHPTLGSIVHHSYHSDKLNKNFVWVSTNTHEIKPPFMGFHECRFQNCLASLDDCMADTKPEICALDGVPRVGRHSHRREIRHARIHREKIHWEKMPDEWCDESCRKRFDPDMYRDGVRREWGHWCDGSQDWNRCGTMRFWGLKNLI